MLTEAQLRKNPSLIKIFMGVPTEVFWDLIEKAEEQMDSVNQKRLERASRKRAFGGGRKCDLPLVIRAGIVLSYLRLNISQEAIAALYGAYQSDVSRQLRQMLPLFKVILPTPELWLQIEEGTPLNEEDLLELSQLSDGVVLIDATEQRVNRPETNDQRKECYSGKKKQFTIKTQIVTDGQHHIVAITISVPGAISDKKLADMVASVERLPDDCQGKADKGYQGIHKQVDTKAVLNEETGTIEEVPRLTFETPYKKPKGGEITEEQEQFNQELGSIRVYVEHCIGWAKNWAILANRFRCDLDLYNSILQVVCGLVNLQTYRWQAL